MCEWKRFRDSYLECNKDGVIRGIIKKDIRTGYVNRDGYIMMRYTSDSSKTIRVFSHVIIAECWIGECPVEPCGRQYTVDHINGIKTDNRVSNLRWVTRADNIRLSLNKRVKQLTLDGELIKIWESASEAGRNGFNQKIISYCCSKNKYRKSHKGFKWEFLEGK